MDKPKLFMILINWSRWTIGFAWEFNKTLVGQWQLEISIQIPVIALSIYKEHNGI